jgi:hypothetical protein
MIVANRMLPPTFPKGVRAAGSRLDPKRARSILEEAGVPVEPEDAEELVRTVRELDLREREERRAIARLAKVGTVVELPFLFTPSFGPAEVEALAGSLADGLAA